MSKCVELSLGPALNKNLSPLLNNNVWGFRGVIPPRDVFTYGVVLIKTFGTAMMKIRESTSQATQNNIDPDHCVRKAPSAREARHSTAREVWCDNSHTRQSAAQAAKRARCANRATTPRPKKTNPRGCIGRHLKHMDTHMDEAMAGSSAAPHKTKQKQQQNQQQQQK